MFGLCYHFQQWVSFSCYLCYAIHFPEFVAYGLHPYVVIKAVCYLNSHGKSFRGGLFHFKDGELPTVVPSAGVSLPVWLFPVLFVSSSRLTGKVSSHQCSGRSFILPSYFHSKKHCISHSFSNPSFSSLPSFSIGLEWMNPSSCENIEYLALFIIGFSRIFWYTQQTAVISIRWMRLVELFISFPLTFSSLLEFVFVSYCIHLWCLSSSKHVAKLFTWISWKYGFILHLIPRTYSFSSFMASSMDVQEHDNFLNKHASQGSLSNLSFYLLELWSGYTEIHHGCFTVF